MTYYTYHKKFSEFSIGGSSTPIDRRTAKMLITKGKGKVCKDRFRRNLGERTILLPKNNYIFIYSIKQTN